MTNLEQKTGVEFWKDYLNNPKNKVNVVTTINVDQLVKEGKVEGNFFDNFEEKLKENGIEVKKQNNFCLENLITLKKELEKLEKGSETLIYYIKKIIKKSTEADFNYLFGDGKYNDELDFIKNDKGNCRFCEARKNKK